MSSVGKRYNSGKLRYRNMPLWLIKPVVEVGHYGETKYDAFNFLKGLSVAGCMDSLYRHLEQVDDPNCPEHDEESKVHHLAHVAWNALVALHFIETRPDLDDRYRTQLALGSTQKLQITIPEEKFQKGDIIKHQNNDVEVTVEDTFYDKSGKPILFVRDADGKIFGVDQEVYRSIYV